MKSIVLAAGMVILVLCPRGVFAADPPFDLMDWTPRPATGKAEPWEKATDKDWIDPRLRFMDTGPFFNATMDYPGPRGKARSYRATAIKLGTESQAAVLFDRNQLRLACGWTGAFLNHSDRRFGLLNTPTPAGALVFTSSSGPGWAGPKDTWDNPHPPTAPLPGDWARYRGLFLHGSHIVLSYTVHGVEVYDSPDVEKGGEQTIITRTVEVGPSDQTLRLLACELPGAGQKVVAEGLTGVGAQKEGVWHGVALLGGHGKVTIRPAERNRVEVVIAPAREVRRFKLLLWQGKMGTLGQFLAHAVASPAAADLKAWTRPGPSRWNKPIVTRGEVGPDAGPFAIDTLTVPYDNPYKALFFLGGVDVLPNGDVAVCTAHGDVWLVKGVTERLEKLTWKRFATGLYQPLGLKIVDGVIHVLERGQLTRLRDRNGDGEADEYECVCNDWHTGNGEHSYDTCLETDPAGNFYFFKTGDTNTPTGGCLMRITKDGEKAEVFATGFRQPIGLGISPAGVILGADQEGNWMPATRIDQYRQGGFYGDMRAHHRPKPPALYDPPLCWLPREVDNSAGGQVWVPAGKFGPLAERFLHLSYGRCKLFLLLRQEVGDEVQGGAVDLGLFFLSGIMRGRFNPIDGHLYVAGLNGWQTAAQRDGCLQRVRYTGKPVLLPLDLKVQANGIRVTFSEKVDRTTATRLDNFRLARWNYHWSGEYGSYRYSVKEPAKVGQDTVPIKTATISEDGRSVFLGIEDLRPVMQMQLAYHLKTPAGVPLVGSVFHTIHRLAKP